MSVRFFNSYSRELEAFHPLDPLGKAVRMYTCGPTVYAHAHIGNFRAYIFEDLLQRHLEARGFQVERVLNLTDVDDKTIRGCRSLGVRLQDFTKTFKDAFFEDIAALRTRRAQFYPSATDYVPRMIEMIQVLEQKGIAYQADDRSVYFRLSKFPDYGKLAHLNLEDLRPSGRVRNDEYEKENIGDFALWKAWDEDDGDVRWDSPWGPGRPGWHIECSAMACALLGDEIDIHCGGIDNLFPHHEAEIAQSESVTGKKFVRYWLHCAHLMVNGQKMSKKLNNFYTLRDLFGMGWSGREVRYALLAVHYQLPLNFTIDEGQMAARAALQRIDDWVELLKTHATQPSSPAAVPFTTTADPFFEALDDNLNISAALGHLFNLIRDSNRAMHERSLSADSARHLLAEWDRMNQVLAIERDELKIPAAVQSLVQQRTEARAGKNWAESDRLRDEILAAGWIVKDTREGMKLTPK